MAIALVMGTLFLFMSNCGPRLRFLGVLTIAACVVISLWTTTSVQLLTVAALSVFVCLTCRAAILTGAGIVFAFLGTVIFYYCIRLQPE